MRASTNLTDDAVNTKERVGLYCRADAVGEPHALADGLHKAATKVSSKGGVHDAEPMVVGVKFGYAAAGHTNGCLLGVEVDIFCLGLRNKTGHGYLSWCASLPSCGAKGIGYKLYIGIC